MDQQSGWERRISQRFPTNLDMRVYAYGMLVAIGMAVDMSEHGLRLRIQQDYSDDELIPGKHLDIMLNYLEQLPTERWFPVRVVRSWEEGIAAVFVGVMAQAV
jgi:hypothetical protein